MSSGGLLDRLVEYSQGMPCWLLMERPGIRYENYDVGTLVSAVRSQPVEPQDDEVVLTFSSGAEVVATHGLRTLVLRGRTHPCSRLYIFGKTLDQVVAELAPYHPA